MTKPGSPSAKNYTGSSQSSGISCPSGSSAGGTTSATNAGTYSQTCSPDANHKWSDGTTIAATISWTINKINPTLTQSATSGSATTANTTSYTISSNVAGAYTASSGNTSYATVSLSTTSAQAANTKVTSTVKAISVNSSAITITVTFKPTDTTNYNTVSKTYSFTPKARTYTITYTKGANVSSISSTSASFTTTGSATSCTFNSSGTTACTPTSPTLPSITANSGYSVAGWYNSNGTKVGNSNGKLVSYTLSSNVTFTANAVQSVTNYAYNGSIQTFTVPITGTYKLETWGASGGYAYSSSRNTGGGGYGGYSVGNITLTKNTVLYVVVGGEGASNCQTTSCAGGYNGGSPSSKWAYGDGTGLYTGGGGGATHIATRTGVLASLSSYRSNVIIVAGGGGGGDYYPDWGRLASGASGGGFVGGSAMFSQSIKGISNTSGTQSSGYAFGTAGTTYTSDSCGGSGGGWYGGLSSNVHSVGAGGSGYIGNSLLTNKHMIIYVYSTPTTDEIAAVYTSTATDTKTNFSTNFSSSAISDYAKNGNGYARITFVSSS